MIAELHAKNEQRYTLIILASSDPVVSDIETRDEGESCISNTTRTRMLQMACETPQLYTSIREVKRTKRKLKFMQIKRNQYIQTPSRS